jgi:ABC-2 type transport system ATP-binding protein
MKIAIIDDGNLITKDTTSNIKSLIDRKQIIISLDDKNFNLEPIMALNVECEINNNTLIINYKPSEVRFNKILDALRLSNIQIKDLNINETKLEDVFLKLTKN